MRRLLVSLVLAAVPLAAAPPAAAQTDAELLEAAQAFPPMPREAADLLGPFVPPADFTFASGTPFNDLEYTLFDTSYIEGETGGFDTFMPADPEAPFPGTGTVKLVRGVNNLDLEAAYSGPPGDRVILGTADVPVPFFLKGPDGVDDDYGVIQNYDYTHGFIQLHGTADDYGLIYATEAEGVATEGHYLFYTGGGDIDLVAFVWPCDELGLPVSGNPPQNDQLLCDDDGRIALDDGVNFRFAPTYPSAPTLPEALAQFGTPGKEIVGGVTADAAGNAYVFGASSGSVGGTLEDAEHSVFVTQFDAGGGRGWTFELEATDGTLLFDAAADGAHLYAVGRTLGALPGFENAGRWDGIVLKLDLATGALVDADQYGTPGLDGYGNVTLDGAGGLYVSGAGSSAGDAGTDPDYLVAKHDAATLDNVWRVVEPPVASGPVFVSEAWGGLSYAPPTDGRPARLLAGGWFMTAGGAAGFLSLYEGIDSNAPQRVAAAILNSAGQEADWVLDNAIGPDGSLYAAGYTTGALGGPHEGDGDAYVARFDADLTNPRFVQTGTPHSDLFRKLELGDDGALFAVGTTYGSVEGANADPEGLTGDVLVQKFSPALDPLATAQFGTAGEERGYAALRGDLVLVGGMTEASLGGESAGSFDAFAVALDPVDLAVVDVGTVGVEPSPQPVAVALYPNPVADAVTVAGVRGVDRYTVFDALGRAVLRGGPVAPGGRIEVAALPPGVYVVRLAARTDVVIRRIVKL
jgi:hypothetical protein